MILEEIRLKDFRCFFGEQRIRFAKEERKNVTIIYAENGFGKTTVLNALLWCLYGETTARFEKKNEILNYDAEKIGRTNALVEVIFINNEMRYKAQRVFDAKNNRRESFIVSKVLHGSQIPIDPPAPFINSVMPKDMAPHFLFDGEHAEVFLGESNRRSIKKSIHEILGCGLVKSAISDLNYISKKYKESIPSTINSREVSSLEEERTSFLDIVEKSEKNRKEAIEKRNGIKEQIDDIDAKLRNSNSEAVKELQARRDELNKDIKLLSSEKRIASDEVYRWLGESGRYIVSTKISDDAFVFLEQQENKGQIPSPYNEEFVNDLLSVGECICGTKLTLNSKERRKVSDLLSKAADQTMRDRVTKVRARISNLKKERAKVPGRLRQLKRNLAKLEQQFDQKEATLEDVSSRLKGINIKDISEREKSRRDLEQRMLDTQREIGKLDGEISRFKIQAHNREKEIRKLAARSEAANKVIDRVKLCDSVRHELEYRLENEEKKAREILERRIVEVLNNTSHKSFSLHMSDEYAITLQNEDGKVLAKSSGENQLLGLAFTAALIEFAKMRSGKKDYHLLPGTISPLVLDSPFGQLDDSYRKTTAQFVPKMANQIVLLVSRTQGTEDVISSLEDHIGSQYILIRYNKGSNEGKAPEIRNLQGKTHKITYFDSEFDGTKIVEVN